MSNAKQINSSSKKSVKEAGSGYLVLFTDDKAEEWILVQSVKSNGKGDKRVPTVFVNKALAVQFVKDNGKRMLEGGRSETGKYFPPLKQLYFLLYPTENPTSMELIYVPGSEPLWRVS